MAGLTTASSSVPATTASILQAYLGKAGLKTLCIERRHVAGGGLSTVEDPRHPGFLHNTHAFFQRAITAMPWYADLELERHGAHYIEPELNVALLDQRRRARSNGGPTSIGPSRRSQQFSRRDAETLRRWQHEFVPIVRDILVPESRVRTAAAGRAARRCSRRSAAGRRLLEVSALSPLEFVHQEFEHPTVKAGLLFFNGLREVDLRVRRLRPSHRGAAREPRQSTDVARRHRRRLHARSKRRCARAAARYRLMTEPARIVVENGRAVGVETAKATLIRARHFVASSLNPTQTFVDLLDEALVPRDDARAGRTLPVQSARAVVRAASQSARAAALCGERTASRACARLHGDHGARSRRSVPRHRAPSRSRHDPADRDVGRLSDTVRPEPGAGRPPHSVHVGEAALPA